MKTELYKHLSRETEELKATGLYKDERIITSQQQAEIKVKGTCEVINFCANNYLGLSNNKTLIESAHRALDDYGFGMSSVRFICGTLDIHKELESARVQFNILGRSHRTCSHGNCLKILDQRLGPVVCQVFPSAI